MSPSPNSRRAMRSSTKKSSPHRSPTHYKRQIDNEIQLRLDRENEKKQRELSSLRNLKKISNRILMERE